MTRVRFLILFSLIIVVSGCSATRSNLSVSETDALEEPVAILPLISAHITMTADSEEDYLKMAEEINSVLDRLAEMNKRKLLLGPNRVSELVDKAELESLHRILVEPENHVRKYQPIKLAEISKKLEVGKIIRVKVEILRPRAYIEEVGDKGFTYFPEQWCVWFDVSADLFRMSPPKLIATKTIQSHYCGETGVACVGVDIFSVPVPYDTYRRAEKEGLAQTVKEAIAGVLEKST